MSRVRGVALEALALVVVLVLFAAVARGAEAQGPSMPVQACTQALGHEQRWIVNNISSRLKGDTMTVSIRCAWVAK